MTNYRDEIIKYLKENPYAEFYDFLKMFNVNPNTLHFNLKKLRDEGKIQYFTGWRIKK